MISRRSLEAATAVLTGAFGAVVAVSSVDNGIGWSTAGVEAGTFPFIIGLVILGGSLFNLATGWLQPHQTLLAFRDLARVGALFLPAAIYVAAIPLAGMYLASAAYLMGALRLQNRVSTPRALIIAAVTALSLYLVFERMFQVSLPHGVLGDTLGF